MDNTPVPIKILRIIFLLITGYLGWHGYKMELKVEQNAAEIHNVKQTLNAGIIGMPTPQGKTK